MNVKLLLVRPGGTFRRQNGRLTNDFPDHVINHRDKHAYPLTESPIIPVSKPYPLNTYEELVEAPPIPPNLAPESYLMIGEDGGVWPYSPKLVQDVPGMSNRQRKRQDWATSSRASRSWPPSWCFAWRAP